MKLLPPSNAAADTPNPISVRSSAVQAIGRIRYSAAIPSIRAAINADPIDEAHPDQQNFAVLAAAAIGQIGSQEGEAVLLPLLHSVQPVANSALIALATILNGNSERFFSLVEKNRFLTPAALPAWVQSMAALGGPDAAGELNRLLVQTIEHETGSQPDLLSNILASLAKLNPPGFQETLSPFLISRDTAIVSAAISAYQPKDNSREPWIPIAQAFADCCVGDSGARIDILFRLTPWIGEPKVQQVLWTGLKDPDRGVRLASLALLKKAGASGSIEDPGPSGSTLTDTVSLALASSRKNSTIALVETSRGTLEIELFREDAPLTVSDFTFLAKKGAFNGFVFEPVIASQRVGGKDVEAQPAFGRAVNGEINMRPFERGSVGVTPAGGRYRTGRFFIALAPQPYLDGVSTCFGRVISGIQVADRIVPGDRILHVNIKETISFLDHIRY
jgi:cyclophilin family peptidyl-prolyl cis-trans isomerase